MYLYLFYMLTYLYNIVVNQNVKERALFLQKCFFLLFYYLYGHPQNVKNKMPLQLLTTHRILYANCLIILCC